MITNEAIEKFLKNNPAMTTDEAKQAIADAEAQSILATADERTRFLTNVNGGRDDAQQHAPGEIDAEALDSLVKEADGKANDDNDAKRTQALGLVREHHRRFDFKAAQEAEQAKGEGLDFDISFFRRYGDGIEFVFTDEYGKGENGVKLVFQGLNFISACTGGGKTFFTCALAALALRKAGSKGAAKTPSHVVFITLEEPASDITKHIITAYLNTPKCDEDKQKIKNTPRITERDVTTALLGKLDDADKVKIIEDAYNELVERLTVIDKLSFQQAAQAAEKAGKLNGVLDAERLENGSTASAVICEALKFYQDKGGAVFFIDFVQKMKDPDAAKSAATYKEMQAVTEYLIDAASANAIVFIAAQMSREGIKGSRAKSRRLRHASEFYGMIAENMRLAADIEQSAQKIIYLTIDEDTNKCDDDSNSVDYINMRLLKNRSGIDSLYASAPIDYAGRTIDFTAFTIPTLPLDEQNVMPKWKNDIAPQRTAKPVTNPAPSTTPTQTQIFTDEAGQPYEAASSYAEADAAPLTRTPPRDNELSDKEWSKKYRLPPSARPRA